MSEAITKKPLNGWWVFAAFFLFFAVIVLVNSVFITMALKTNSGVVTEDPYRKGLRYNKTLELARSQPNVDSNFYFENNAVRWAIRDEADHAIENAQITAKFTRPVKEGYDFNVQLHHDGNGVYSVKPEFPVKGSWKVVLSAKWDNKTYQISKPLIVQ